MGLLLRAWSCSGLNTRPDAAPVFLHPSHELSVMMWWSCPKEVNDSGEDRGGVGRAELAAGLPRRPAN
jgi:hypothetical protein